MGGRGQGSSLGSYKTFKGMPTSGWEYSGDGRDEEFFFATRSNYLGLIGQMSGDEKDAFRTWATGHFMHGQQYDGWDRLSDYDKALTQTYDKFLDKSFLTEGVEVVRMSDAQLVLGAGRTVPRSLSELKALEGLTLTAVGNMSFAAAKQGLTIGDWGKKVEYKLRIPKGTFGAGMWIGDDSINHWGSQQREFLTNRDIVLKVGKSHYDSKRDVYVVELNYKGSGDHDYGYSGKLGQSEVDYWLS